MCVPLRWATLVVAAGLLAPRAACAQESDSREVAARARAALKAHCHRCHHGSGSEGGDFDVLKAETLTAPREDGPPYVVAGRPADSFLYQRMALRRGGKGDMPPGKVLARPEDADKAAVKRWIEAKAPPFPAAERRPFVSSKDVLTVVREDLRKAESEDRPFLRYFTLTHLHNNPEVPDADLRVYRAALSKAVNSLSWKADIVLPRAVDEHQTVFAVDVRDLDWDRDDLWYEVMRSYPYGLRHRTHPDKDWRQLDEDVTRLSDCELPLVRADWFMATATRPPLYHALLQLPGHAGELERKLGVHAIDNFLRDRLSRGGFAASGVSGQNRLVERHDALHGSYWKSYDFKADNARSSLPRFPLGPAFPRHPHPDQAFEHDGGEIIFGLPNGLHGYLLVDGKGNRIDEGPIAVVGDANKTAGTNAIVTGVSCMACHTQGLIPFQDQIRDGTTVRGAAREKVRRLYPPADVLREKLQKDTKRYTASLEGAIGPFLKVGEDAAKKLRDFPEVVGATARLYRLQNIDLAVAAYELGFARPGELKTLFAGNRLLRELGLGVLLQEGGSIPRLEWERAEPYSLPQRVARELENGSPFRAGRAPATAKLRDEIRGKLAVEIRKLLSQEKQEAVAVGEFTGPDQPDANSGHGIRRLLTEELRALKVIVDPKANLTVRGRYAKLAHPRDPRLSLMRLTAEVCDRNDERTGEFFAQIRYSADNSPSKQVEASRVTSGLNGTSWRKVQTFRHADKIFSVSLSADGRRVLIGSADNTAALWEADSGRKLQSFRHPDKVFSVALSADGRRVLTGSADNTATLWGADSGMRLQSYPHVKKVSQVAFRADGRRVLTGSDDTTAGLWEADSGRKLQTYGHDNLVWSATLSADGRRVLTGCSDKSGVLWEADSARRLRAFRHDDWVASVAFSADGRRVLTGSFDKTAVLWEADTGRRLRTFRHDDWVLSAALSADGHYVLTGSRDRTAVLWEADTGKCLQTFRHEDPVSAVAFSADGRRVLTGSFDNSAVLWEADCGTAE